MKRHLIALATATLLLGGCSGGEAPAEADASTASPDAANQDGEAKAKPNPWASDTPAPPAEAAKEDEARPDEAAKPKVNPWAKDPPPGAVPSDTPEKD